MTRCVYPGSFNPVHPGHIHIMAQAALLFGNVTVLIAVNPEKVYKVGAEARKELILGMIEGFPWVNKVKVDITDNTLMEYCGKKRIPVIVRGVRNGNDLEYERSQREYAMRLGKPGFPVSYVYLAPDVSLDYLSSTYVRNFIKYCTPLQLGVLYNSTLFGEVLPFGEVSQMAELYKE